eukprot:Gb_04742 [translate_table: standard]
MYTKYRMFRVQTRIPQLFNGNPKSFLSGADPTRHFNTKTPDKQQASGMNPTYPWTKTVSKVFGTEPAHCILPTCSIVRKKENILKGVNALPSSVGVSAFHAFSYQRTPIRLRYYESKQLHIMANLATTDLCDAYQNLVVDGTLRILHPMFQIYGSRKAFSGPVATLKIFEDNVLLRQFLEEQGNGRVLVVDGGGSLRCALLGGNLAIMAQNNGWNGVIVNGCVRDADEINRCDIGVRALATHPLKSNKKGIGEKNVVVFIGGTRISAGEYCYADCDGIVISPTELSV